MRFWSWITALSFLFAACSAEHTNPTAHSTSQPLTLEFQQTIVDSSASGDCKAIADVDGDYDLDLLLAGSALAWYEAPTWSKHTVATASNEFTTFGWTGDVDGDGDPDFLTGDGPTGNNIIWLENPRPSGSPTSTWSRHTIGAAGNYAKDVLPADFDNDGRLDVAIRAQGELMVFFQNAAASWTRVSITTNNLGTEGATSGDVDDDGFVDLVIRGAWARNPGSVRARTDTWATYTIGSVDTDFKALVANVDGRPGAEVLFSSSENTANIVWFGASDPRGGTWTSHTIVSSLEDAHTLQAGDFDLDGVLDVVVGQMHTAASTPLLRVFLNGGDGTSWTPLTINSGGGVHNGVVADVDHDGLLDVWGANFIGSPNGARLWTSAEVGTGGTGGAGEAGGAGGATGGAGGTADASVDASADAIAEAGDATVDAGNPNLILAIACNEGTGTTAVDSSGNGWNATLTGGASWATGHTGSACAFSGSTSQYGAISSGLNANPSALTVMTWVFLTGTNSSVDARYVSKASGVQANDHIFMLGDTDSSGRRLRFRLRTSGSTTTLIGSSTLSTSTWVHAAASYDGATMRLYQNASQVASVGKTGTIDQSSSVAVNLGRNPDGSNAIQGRLDDVRIFSVALSASEIAVEAGL